MLHLDENKEYLNCFSNGFAKGIENKDTLKQIIIDIEKSSNRQNTTNWLHLCINGIWQTVGKTERVYSGYYYDYKFFFNNDFAL